MIKAKARGFVLLLFTSLLAFTLAGCGSGSSKESSGGQSSVGMAAPAAAEQEQLSKNMSVREGNVAATDAKAASQAQGAALAGNAAPVADASAAAGIGALVDPGAGLNRKVIYKANVTMKVEDYDAAEEKLRNAIHQSGSYILQFSNSVSANEKGATYVIKVPADGFSSFLDQLRQIQQDLQLQMEGSDVTEEYVDLEARLKAKQTAEARLLAFMDKATKTDDLVRFQSELAGVQEQIEQIKGRMRYLDQNVAYSTVNIRMYEGKAEAMREEPAKSGLGERLADALTGSAKVLGQFGQALLVFVAALLPVLVVAAVVGVPIFYIVRRQSRTRRETAADRRREWNKSAAAAPTPPGGEGDKSATSAGVEPETDANADSTADPDRPGPDDSNRQS